MNAIIAGEDSIADHVTIRGKINGEGYVDVNYDSSVSTGGTLEYLGLVKVEGGDDGDSLRLKDSIQIGDLYYRLMWSSKENEYYLQSSVTDPAISLGYGRRGKRQRRYAFRIGLHAGSSL